MFDEFARGLHWLGQGAGAAVGMDEEPDPVELLKNPIVTIRRLGDYPLLMVIGAACLWAAAAGAFVMISPGASAQVTEGGLQTSVGIANKVVREVKGKRGAYVRQIALKDEVYQNERISTGPGAAAEIVLRDNTRISLGPKSSLVLDKFVFDPMPSRRKVVMNAVGGVFRFVTGNSPSNSYQIKTGSATLGIRGTIFTLIVAFNGAATVSVSGDAVLFSNLAGDSVLVTPGLASTIRPPATDGTQSAPSAPAEPSLPVTSTTQHQRGRRRHLVGRVWPAHRHEHAWGQRLHIRPGRHGGRRAGTGQGAPGRAQRLRRRHAGAQGVHAGQRCRP